MTTKLLEWPTHLLWAANENYAPTVQASLNSFKEKLLATTALSPVDAKLREYNAEAMGILNLNQMTAEEKTTYLLAKFFKDTKHAVNLILKDRKTPVASNNNPSSLLQAA